MKRSFATAVLVLVAGWTVGGTAGQTPPADAISRIRAEGLTRSQVMDTAFWLTDRYGPRLNGSPEFEEAGEWAIGRLRSWGVTNLRKERFEVGRGWSLVAFHATMIEPRVMPIIGMPKAWTPGTSGTITAEVVRPVITTEADAQKYRGQLRGKIVLTQSARAVRMLDAGDGTVLRYDDRDGKWRAEAMTLPLVESADRQLPAGRGGNRGAGPPPFSVMRFYKDEGVVAALDRGSSSDLAAGGSDLSWQQQRVDGGTLFVQSGASPFADPAGTLPQVTLAVEHYNRMVRLIDRGIPVRVELNIGTKFTEETRPNGFNIVGEIAGSDRRDEVVLLGAHFDSWHGATGATDNAAGVAAMMEAFRILKAAGLVPRRTIRIGLWGSEEAGILGSAHYVREHLGTLASPKPEQRTLSAYFNLDNGTGRIRGIWSQGNQAAEAIFRSWAAPLRDLGVDLISPRSVQDTDHEPFDDAGIPAFQFVQERYEYNSRTHHSTMDVYDRLQAEDLKQVATVAAMFAWHAAMHENLMPRRAGADRQGR